MLIMKRKTLKHLRKIQPVDSFHESLLIQAGSSYFKSKKEKKKVVSPEIIKESQITELVAAIEALALRGSCHDDENDDEHYSALVYFLTQSVISDKRIGVSEDKSRHTVEPWRVFMKTLDLTDVDAAEEKIFQFLEKAAQEFKRQHPKWTVWCTEDGGQPGADCSPLLVIEDRRTSWDFWIDVTH